MITTPLRNADPAADSDVLATSDTAEVMLRGILATPRVESSPKRRRRLIFRPSFAGAAAAAVVAVPMLMTGGGLASSAYAVEQNDDGSFEVAIDFDQFSDPMALQHTLDDHGIPATVLSGPGTSINIDANGKIQVPYSVPDCARFDRLAVPPGTSPDDPNQPLALDTSGRFGDTALVLRPNLLPAGATFVVQIIRSNGHVAALSGEVAVGAPPTCLL